MNVRVHVPKLESLPSSATDGNPAGQYTHLLQLRNASSEDKTPDALRAALSKDIHERLLTDFNLFERNRGDLSADDWAALSKSDVVDRARVAFRAGKRLILTFHRRVRAPWSEQARVFA